MSESAPESWSRGTGAIFNCSGAQNRINFTKFEHDFKENMLMAKGLDALCTENGAGKSLSRRSKGLEAREKGGDAEAIVIRISIMV
jgi:hypothetical protein